MTSLADIFPAAVRAPAAGRYLRLAKPGIAALCTLSAATAFRLAAPPSSRILPPLAGLALLSCGAGALNQYQERDLDSRMPRTCRRPLPAGEIGARQALLFSGGLLAFGLLLLQGGGGTAAALLGLVGVLWYNGVYTPLKRRTALAPLPGAIVGAIPPAIGWVSAGGAIGDPRLLALCALLFLWQLPHFGLILLAHSAEQSAAGLPVLTDLAPPRRLARFISFSILATTTVGLLQPLPSAAALTPPLLAGAALALAAYGSNILGCERAALRAAFMAINAYLLVVLTLLLLVGVRG